MRASAACFLVTVLAAAGAFATTQSPELFFHEGNEYCIPNTYPMEPYFQRHPEQRPQGLTTGLYRGYVATYELKDKTLVLKDIIYEKGDWLTTQDDKGVTDEMETSWVSMRDRIVPDGGTFVVDWFTGMIVIHEQLLAGWRYQGCWSPPKNLIFLEFRKGKLVDERRFDDFRECERHMNKWHYAARQAKVYKKRVPVSEPKVLRRLRPVD